jgi:hypothetical protein
MNEELCATPTGYLLIKRVSLPREEIMYTFTDGDKLRTISIPPSLM